MILSAFLHNARTLVTPVILATILLAAFRLPGLPYSLFNQHKKGDLAAWHQKHNCRQCSENSYTSIPPADRVNCLSAGTIEKFMACSSKSPEELPD
jgi:hypothetical protein